MPVLNFQGQLLIAQKGTNEERGTVYTRLEFSPQDGQSFSVFLNDHIDLTQHLRKELDWSLDCQVGRGGKLYVNGVHGSALKKGAA